MSIDTTHLNKSSFRPLITLCQEDMRPTFLRTGLLGKALITILRNSDFLPQMREVLLLKLQDQLPEDRNLIFHQLIPEKENHIFTCMCWRKGYNSESVSHSVMSDSATPQTVAHQAPLSMGFSKQEYWSGLLFPSPGVLPDPGIKLGLLYCRWILCRLSQLGSPIKEQKVQFLSSVNRGKHSFRIELKENRAHLFSPSPEAVPA